MGNFVYKFRRPLGSPQQEPSVAMTEALQRLSEAEEMVPLITEARQRNRPVSIEVFHSRQGLPVLIHVALQPKFKEPK